MGYDFDFTAIVANAGLFAEGIGITLLLTTITAIFGLALSVGGAAMALYAAKPLRWLVTAYVELIRNTPFIVQLFFIFFGLPSLGLRLSAFTASAIAMVVNLVAYGLEIVRAGILAVPKGQYEGARALGLRPSVTFLKVVLPQAIATVYPALASQIIIMMLESAVVSQIAVADLTHIADYIQSRTYRAFETYFVTAALYLALALALRRLLDMSGQRLFFSWRRA